MASKAMSGKGTVLSIGENPIVEVKTFQFSGGKNDTEDVSNSDSPGLTQEALSRTTRTITGPATPRDTAQQSIDGDGERLSRAASAGALRGRRRRGQHKSSSVAVHRTRETLIKLSLS